MFVLLVYTVSLLRLSCIADPYFVAFRCISIVYVLCVMSRIYLFNR